MEIRTWVTEVGKEGRDGACPEEHPSFHLSTA
jgi:hypothetical protein